MTHTSTFTGGHLAGFAPAHYYLGPPDRTPLFQVWSGGGGLRFGLKDSRNSLPASRRSSSRGAKQPERDQRDPVAMKRWCSFGVKPLFVWKRISNFRSLHFRSLRWTTGSRGPVHPSYHVHKEPGILGFYRSMVLVFGTTGTPSERSWFAWMPWVCPTEVK